MRALVETVGDTDPGYLQLLPGTSALSGISYTSQVQAELPGGEQADELAFAQSRVASQALAEMEGLLKISLARLKGKIASNSSAVS